MLRIKMGNVCAVTGAILLACIVLINQLLDYRKSMTCGEGWNTAPAVVAAVDISKGGVITPDMIERRMIPEPMLPPSAVEPDRAGLIVGQTALIPLKRGDLVLWSEFSSDSGSAGVPPAEIILKDASAPPPAGDDFNSAAKEIARRTMDWMSGKRVVPCREWNLLPVVIADVDIDAGKTITMDMMERRMFPALFVTSSVVKVENASLVDGRKALIPIRKGEMLLWQQLEGEEFGAAFRPKQVPVPEP